MRKNNLIWIFVLFLINIITLPVAYAQAATASWFYVFVNAAIVGVILFALQTFLIPGKVDKEKTAVYVIIIAASLLIGLLFGREGLIYNTGIVGAFFRTYAWYIILVNALIITAVLYFVLGLLDKNKRFMPGSPQGISGVGILLFLISIVFAVKLGNRWIWQLENVQYFITYLFGADGILVYPKIIVFITSFVVLAYFFTVYLGQKIAGSKFITYALAAILAASMASAGVGLPIVIRIAELVFLIVLADALEGKVGDATYKWGLAFLIVGWSSASLTAAFGPEYEGIIGSFMAPMLRYYGLIKTAPGAPIGFAPLLLSPPVLVAVVILFAMDIVGTGRYKTIGKGGVITWLILLLLSSGFSIGLGNFGTIGMWVLIPIAIVVLLLLVIGRAGKREGIIGAGKKRGWQEIKRKLRQNKPAAFFMRRVLRMRNEIFPDDLPFEIKDMRLEIYTLFNWMLRHEIWLRKGAGVTEVKQAIKKAEQLLGKERPTEEDILRGIKNHIEGAAVVPVGDYWDKQGESVGWGRFYFIFVQLMNELKQDLEKDLTQKPEKTESATTQAGNWIRVGKGKTFLDNAWTNHITARYNRYLSGIGRYKGWLITRANNLFFHDMLNMYGAYQRGYFFPKPGANLDRYSYKLKNPDPEDQGKTVTREIDWDSLQKIAENVDETIYEEGGTKGELLELNLYGWCISDINAIQIEEKNLPYIRRFKVGYIDNNGKYKSDVSELHLEDPANARFEHILTFSEKDWDFATKDMATGMFHPLTRRIDDYNQYFNLGYEKFSAAPFIKPMLMSEIGFDREALKIPHTVNFWGRKKYFEDTPNGPRLYPANPYPAISLKGLWDFVYKYSIASSGNEERTKALLNDYFKLRYDVVDKIHVEKK